MILSVISAAIIGYETVKVKCKKNQTTYKNIKIKTDQKPKKRKRR